MSVFDRRLLSKSYGPNVVTSFQRSSRVANFSPVLSVGQRWLVCFMGLVFSFSQTVPLSAQPAPSPQVHQQLPWREMGPFRGGRTTAVAGIPGDPLKFYIGTVGGGVWRTDNAGNTWKNVSDGWFGTGSIGAIAISPSDPNRIYVGTGESPYRLYMSSHGDGMYRSDDGGSSWRNIGLPKTRQIGGIAINPQNPDTLLVAAQGDPWNGSEDRGIYRSTDGGATWQRTLASNPTTGAVEVMFDPFNSNIAYAATWDHDYDPWFLRSGGPGSTIHKSIDGGRTWTKASVGLPSSMGKIGIAVSPVKSGLIWAIVEAGPGQGGLYRSDNGGQRWHFVNADRRVHTRSWYYMHIWADPKSADGIYVLANPPTRSTDGGKTFTEWEVRGWDFHALWMDPTNPKSMVIGSDGGATVTVDGGESWSSLNNQPTAQLYRVHADATFPYFIYAAQQDSTTFAMSSDVALAGPDSTGFKPVGGGESGFISTHPTNTRYVYASSELGTLTEYDRQTGDTRFIGASLAFPEGTFPRELRLRYAVNSPVLVSWDDPSVVYHAAQKVMRTTDRGASWTAVSPDLTRNDQSKQGNGGGPFSGELINHYGAISYLTQSSSDARTLWAGSNDGFVHVTTDGVNWENVTPSEIQDGSIDSIEISSHAAGRAFVVVNRMRFGDYSAHIFRTDDYGKSWTRISNSLPEETIARVIREDSVRKGLLFAGTERGLYISYDDGRSWSYAGRNIPVSPITELVIRRNDVVASTQGRGIWVLNNIAPLRQFDSNDASGLLKPESAYLLYSETGYPPGSAYEFTAKPGPSGASIDFNLDSKSGDASIEILNSAGQVLRTLKSSEDAPFQKGFNRIQWDLREEPIEVVSKAFDGFFDGPRVGPGNYTVRLVVGQRTFEQPLVVTTDPRSSSATEEVATRARLIGDMKVLLGRVSRTVEAVRLVAQRNPAKRSAAEAWEAKIHAPQLEIGQDRVNYGGRYLFDLMVFFMAIDSSAPPYGPSYEARLKELTAEWDKFEAEAPTN
jgi:photosystem II stability/assembly factor-like uncharacterized protein